MDTNLEITTEPIETRKPSSSTSSNLEIGASIEFYGMVRETEGTQKIKAIEYEAFSEMAEHQFHKIFKKIENQWPILSVRVIHRIGTVPIGIPSLWVEVKSSHRDEAFSACRFLINEMKKKVPIWKKPIPADFDGKEPNRANPAPAEKD